MTNRDFYAMAVLGFVMAIVTGLFWYPLFAYVWHWYLP